MALPPNWAGTVVMTETLVAKRYNRKQQTPIAVTRR